MYAPLLLALIPTGDQLLVSSFQPASISAYSLSDASFEGDLGSGSPLAGTLGSTLGPDGLLYVASEASNQVLRFDPASMTFVDVFVGDDPGTVPDESGGLSGPSGVVFGPDGRLYVGSFQSDAVLAYDGITGVFDEVFVEPSDGNLNGPDSGMAFGPDGHLYVPSFFNNRVKRYAGDTGDFLDNFLKPTPSGLTNPRAVFWPGDGSILATSEGSDQVLRFDATTGDFLEVWIGDDPTTPGIDESGGLDGPTGIVRDVTGVYWVASVQTSEVKRYDSQGSFIDTPISAGAISSPVHLTTRPRSENICATSPNSLGQGALLAVTGSASVALGEVSFHLSQAPPAQLAVLAQASFGGPFSVGQGSLCLGGPVYRLGAIATDGQGRGSWSLLPGQSTTPVILPGSSWDFQVGYRDGGTVLNFSSSLRLQFVP